MSTATGSKRAAKSQGGERSARAHSPCAGLLQRKCACGSGAGLGGSCEDCENKRLQRKGVGASVAPGKIPPQVDSALRAPGLPLDAGERKFFEPRFGHDFGHVRVHVDDAAAESVQAQAFASGHHIVFAGNRYRPGTPAGRRLLAHELTHVVQQQCGTGLQGGIGPADDHFERHADALADRIAAGRSAGGLLPAASSAPSGTRAVQRDTGLLPPEKVDEVYNAWIVNLSKARETGAPTKGAVSVPAREQTKRQVGPANFANWEKWRTGQDKADAEEAKAEEEARNRPAKPFNPEADLQTNHAQLKAAGLAMNKEVARVEGLAAHVNFGSGVKGSVARATAGGYTALWGVGGRTVSSAVNHAPMLLLEGAGVGLGSEYAERKLVEEGREIKKEGQEMGDDVRTGVRLAGGAMQENYDATRPSYKKFMTALKVFTDADIAFGKDAQLEGMTAYVKQSEDFASMKTAFNDMREASNEFLMLCAKLGIENDAKALNVLGNHIVKGMEESVGTAVNVMGGELMPSPGEVWSAFKGPGGMGVKQLEKEAQAAVNSTLKGSEEAAVGSGSKSALKSAEKVGAGAGAHAPEIKQGDAAKFVEEHPPTKVEGEPGSRHAKVEGGHEVVEVPGGGCELHSPAPFPKVPCPWQGKNLDEAVESAFGRLEAGKVPQDAQLLTDLLHHGQQAEALAEKRAATGTAMPGKPGRTPPGTSVNPNPGYQSAHTTPQAVLRDLPPYDPDEMITRLLPTGRGHAHTKFDQMWQSELRTISKTTGRTTTTAAELQSVLERAARQSGAFSPAEAESMVGLIHEDLFVRLGLKPDTVLRMPGK